MAKEELFGMLCTLVIYCFGCVLCSENVLTGTEYTFKPEIAGKIQTIDWRRNMNLVFDWEPTAGLHWYQLEFQKRARFNAENGELSLNLTKQDSGDFECHYETDGVVKIYKITIEVIDRVPKPQVTCQKNGINVILECSVNPSATEIFTWGGPNDLSHVGKSLQITRKQNDADAIYYCTARNEVSQETAEYKLQLCDETRDPKPDVAAIVGSLIGVVLCALIVMAVIFYIKRKRGGKTSAAKSDRAPNEHAQDPATCVFLTTQET